MNKQPIIPLNELINAHIKTEKVQMEAYNQQYCSTAKFYLKVLMEYRLHTFPISDSMVIDFEPSKSVRHYDISWTKME